MQDVQIGGVKYVQNEYGMLQEKYPKPFTYDENYLAQQSTTREMSALRMGFLLAHFPFDRLRQSRVLELGPGTGVFFRYLKPHVAWMDGYDVVTDSHYCTVTLAEAQQKRYDLLVAFDVLEHFSDVNDLWKYKFDVGYFSIPCPPHEGLTAEWRHWKPGEHVAIITAEQFCCFVRDHGYKVLAEGCPEDLIRQRWSKYQRNINSFIIQKQTVD